MKRTFFAAAAAAMALIACNKEEIQAPQLEGFKTVTISASLPEDADVKATVADDGKFAWESTDIIGINVKYTDNGQEVKAFYEFTCTSAEGNSATFTGQIPASGEISEVAVYPYSEKDSYTDGKLSVCINDGTAHTAAHPKMVAKIVSGSNGLEFSPVCGLVKLTYRNVPVTASCLHLSSDKAVTGQFTVNLDDLSLSAESTAATSVTMSFDTPAEKGTSISLYAQIPAGDHAVSAMLQNSEGTEIRGTKCTLSESLTAKNGLITLLPEISLPKMLYYESMKIYGTDNTVATLPALAWHNNEFWCAFREGTKDSGAGGVLKVMKSTDGDEWNEVQALEYEKQDIDLSDGLAFNPSGSDNKQFMLIEHHEDFDFTSDESFSVTGWLKSAETTYSQIVSTRQGGGGYDFGQQNNHLYFDIEKPYLRCEATGTELTTNEWHHVAFSYNGTNKSIALYVDGKAQSFTTGSNVYPQTGFNGQGNTQGNHIFVMTRGNTYPSTATGASSQSLTGNLKTLRFWNKALSADEITADMTASVTSETPGLVAAYDFSQMKVENGAGVVHDIKGKHDGKISGISFTSGEIREPNLLNTPDGRLMIAATGVKYSGTTLTGRQAVKSFLETGASKFGDLTASAIYTAENTTNTNPILWSPKFHGNSLYGVEYLSSFALYKSDDYGTTYNKVCDLDKANLNNPNEVALAWNSSDQLYTFIRNSGNAYVGVSDSPYTSHSYSSWNFKLESASVIAYNDDILLIAARTLNDSNSNVIRVMSTDWSGNVICSTDLSCGGTMGHPGLAIKDNDLYAVYHSSHDGNTAIFLSRLPLEDFVTKAE